MRVIRRLTLALSTAVIVVLALSACSVGEDAINPDGTVNLSAVTLNVGDQAGIQQAILEASGALDGAQYKVQWAQFPAAAPLLESLKSQAIDVGYTGDAPFINALAAGAKISAISATKASGANGLAIIVPQNSPIHSVADLRGKTVSPTTQGSIGHYELLAALKEASVSAQDTTISFLDPVNAAAAFKSGDIDAWSTWDPYTAVAQVEDHARIIRDAEGISSKLGLLSANDDAIADKAKHVAMTDFATRFGKALTWAEQHPTEYTRIYGKLTGRPENVSSLVAERSQRSPAPLDKANIQALQTVADQYLEFGVIRRPVVVADHTNQLSAQ
ncbi:ABC transporter substrate-binding protein [Streptomyces sp. SID6673]|nr:ABC transporter substrate-binding protein [Streptomyces sp. SID11726]NEB26127.1 ABC transporter substrate-binding protein [Streptomyces sp. SID6673]